MTHKFIYSGERNGARSVVGVYVQAEDGTHEKLDPRFDLCEHSPSGFEWGYSGHGPLQLALAIMAHYARSQLREEEAVDESALKRADDWALLLYERFKESDVFATLSNRGDFTLTSEDIKVAIEAWAPEERADYPVGTHSVPHALGTSLIAIRVVTFPILGSEESKVSLYQEQESDLLKACDSYLVGACDKGTFDKNLESAGIRGGWDGDTWSGLGYDQDSQEVHFQLHFVRCKYGCAEELEKQINRRYWLQNALTTGRDYDNSVLGEDHERKLSGELEDLQAAIISASDPYSPAQPQPAPAGRAYAARRA